VSNRCNSLVRSSVTIGKSVWERCVTDVMAANFGEHPFHDVG
jgi:hypothetical protein